MKKLFFFASFLFLFNACNGSKNTTETATTEKSFTVEYLAKNSSDGTLKQQYPDAEISEGVGLFDEGTEERAYTILYPGTDKEIHLIWKDREKSSLHQIVFSGTGNWASSTGIKIGTTYDELVALNKKPIKVFGFGWDYSGAVDWNEGKMQKTKLRVFLKPEKEPDTKFYGDGVINPTGEELKELNLTVGNIIYHLGDD